MLGTILNNKINPTRKHKDTLAIFRENFALKRLYNLFKPKIIKNIKGGRNEMKYLSTFIV
ncbi:MAG: hypothetical protein Kow0019_07910 [Methanobacteriaceae archaeon]